jgi:hypothetical protein
MSNANRKPHHRDSRSYESFQRPLSCRCSLAFNLVVCIDIWLQTWYALERASFLNLGMSELTNRENSNSVVSASSGQGGVNLDYRVYSFLDALAIVDFDTGLDFDGHLLQFY